MRADLEPFFFGPSEGQLFGLHYPPTSEPIREVGILLCAPIGHEYIVAHRAYRQLCIRLADVGFHVVRFDYHATGDSSGACEEGLPGRWMRDISVAIGELRSRARCRKVCLVGCRLGATFCALVGADRGDVDHMVLWDPVENGAEHVVEIRNRHQDMLRRTHVSASARASARASASATSSDAQELLGFAISNAALREIEAIDLLTLGESPAKTILLLESHATDTSVRLRAHLERVGAHVEHHRMPVARAWSWIEDPDLVLVPHQIITAAVEWIDRAHQ